MGYIYDLPVQDHMIYCNPEKCMCTVVIPREEGQACWSDSDTTFLALSEKVWEQLQWAHHFAGQFLDRYTQLPFESDTVLPPSAPGNSVLFTMIHRRIGGERPEKYKTWSIPSSMPGLQDVTYIVVRFRYKNGKMRMWIKGVD